MSEQAKDNSFEVYWTRLLASAEAIKFQPFALKRSLQAAFEAGRDSVSKDHVALVFERMFGKGTR